MIGFKIAAQTGGFAQSLKKALHTVAGLGCDGVQIDARNELQPAELSDTGLRQLRKMLDDLNLRVGSIAFPTRRGYSNPVDLQPRLEATRAAMQLASRLGARILIGNLGTLPAGNPAAGDIDGEDASGWATLVDAIQSLASHGDRLGVRLVMQATSPAKQLADFVAQLPEGSLALDLNPARLIAQGESPGEFVATAGKHIAHVHATRRGARPRQRTRRRSRTGSRYCRLSRIVRNARRARLPRLANHRTPQLTATPRRHRQRSEVFASIVNSQRATFRRRCYVKQENRRDVARWLQGWRILHRKIPPKLTFSPGHLEWGHS